MEWLKVVAAIWATAGSLWLVLSQYSSLSRDAADLHEAWQRTHGEYARLWTVIDSPTAESTYHRIYAAADKLSKSATKFPARNDRLEYWLTHAESMANSRYA